MLSKTINNTAVQSLAFGAVVGGLAYLQQNTIANTAMAAARVASATCEAARVAYAAACDAAAYDDFSAYAAKKSIRPFTVATAMRSAITFVCGKAAYAAFGGSNAFLGATALATVGTALAYNYSEKVQKYCKDGHIGSITFGSTAALFAVVTGAAVTKVAEMAR